MLQSSSVLQIGEVTLCMLNPKNFHSKQALSFVEKQMKSVVLETKCSENRGLEQRARAQRNCF